MRKVAVFAVMLALCWAGWSESQIIRRSCYQTYQVQQVVAAPYASYAYPVAVQAPYQFSIDGYYRDKLLVDAIVGRLEQVRLGMNLQPQTQPPWMPPSAQVPTQPTAGIKTAVPAGLPEIVAASCIKCHQANNPAGRADLSDLSVVPEGVRWHAHGLIASGEMPKGGKPLPDADVPKFYEWAKEASKAVLASKKGL